MKKIFSGLAPLLVLLLIPWYALTQSTEWAFATSWSYLTTTVDDAANATGYSGNDTYAIFDNTGDVGCYSGFMEYAETFPYLSIPAGTIVKGIEVSLEGYRSEGSDRQFIVTLFYRWSGGSSITGQRSTTDLDGSDVVHIVGSATDSWGLWSAQHIALANFEVNVSVSGTTGTAYLDHIKVRVHYGMPVSPFVVTIPGEFTVPAGVSSLSAKAWGGGGGGSAYADYYTMYGNGGGGGGFAAGTFGVNPGDVLDIVVGAGGRAGTVSDITGKAGNASKVTSGSNSLTAYGGQGGGIVDAVTGNFLPGNGGSASISGAVTNTSQFTGGNGAANALSIGGGGGGGAGDVANGGNASGSSGGAGGNNYGGNGGNGTTGDGAGGSGSNYGGGGAGASNNPSSAGGRGADGVVILSWLAGCPGSAVSITEETGVTNSADILGQPDGAVTILKYIEGSEMIVDLTGDAYTLPVGTTVTILWRKTSGQNPLIDLETQNDIDPTWTDIVAGNPVTNTTLSPYSFTTTAETRYLLIGVDGTSIEESETLEIDAITYTCPCLAPTPAVAVEDRCGNSVLTASGYTGDLTWSTGETTASIIVNTAGSYSVSQKVGDCLSLSGRATASPYIIPAKPGSITGPANPCGSADAVYSINAVSGATGYVWTVPSGWTIKSGQNTESITVTVAEGAGNVTVKATSAPCESAESSVLAVTADMVCCTTTAADRYEPNNTMETATSLTVGGALIWANILNPKDADWFSFTTAAAGSYSINLLGSGESFALYNDLARKLKATGRTGTTYSLLGSTTYYIKVSSRLKAPASCYSLGVEFVASSQFVVENYEVLTREELNSMAEQLFRIWPNPSADEFSFYNGMKGTVQVQVSDLGGRIMETIKNVNPYETVRFGKHYPAGVYMIRATSGETTRTFKVVKQ